MSSALFENAKDFLIEALKKAIEAETDEKQWKFALFFMVQSIELLLKERLRIENKVLIYTDIDKQKHTVNIVLAINRLINICGLELEEEDKKAIILTNKLRNQILHYTYEVNSQHDKDKFAKLLGFSIQFSRKELDTLLSYEVLEQNLWNEIIKIKCFAEESEKRIQEIILDENFQEVRTCPNCFNDTLILDNSPWACLFCNLELEEKRCSECNEPIINENTVEILLDEHSSYVGCMDCHPEMNENYILIDGQYLNISD